MEKNNSNKLIIQPQESGFIITPSSSAYNFSFNELIDMCVSPDSLYVIIERDNLPDDWDFMDAWEFDFTNAIETEIQSDSVSINMPKAKEIHRDKIRKARKSKLQELDVQFQRELEKGPNANIQPIVDKKQELRDLPNHPDIEAATTVEELKATWNEELLGTSPYT